MTRRETVDREADLLSLQTTSPPCVGEWTNGHGAIFRRRIPEQRFGLGRPRTSFSVFPVSLAPHCIGFASVSSKERGQG